MQVFFCDQCFRRVTEGELAQGDGTHLGDLVFCRFCVERPEVQEQLRCAAETEAARAVGRRTPRRGHSRIGLEVASGRRRAKTPSGGRNVGPGRVDGIVRTTRQHLKVPTLRGKRPTARPVSPVRSEPAMMDVRSAMHRSLCRPRKVAPPKGAAQYVLMGLAGVAIGFIVVAVRQVQRVDAARPTGPRGREVQVRWEKPAGTEAKFEGECTVEQAKGRLIVIFPSGGRWKVRVNGSLAYSGAVPDKARPIRLGAAGRFLKPGTNRIVATCEGNNVEAPPRLFLE